VHYFDLAMAAIFVCYFLALVALPCLVRNISWRYIFLSTSLLGLLCLFFPAVTSQDIFSYITYARMTLFYHLNPLTVEPIAIRGDVIYQYIYWVHQPSIYGPTWVFLTCLFQWLALFFGFHLVLSVQILLRLWGFAMHLCSVYLVYALCQRLYVERSPDPRQSERRCALVTLAFAWNPFLLFEACVNAHNDVTIMCLILLTIWSLVLYIDGFKAGCVLAAVCLALASCLKITLVLFLPGLLFFFWLQQRRRSVWFTLWERLGLLLLVCVVFCGVVVMLYAPFWDHGTLLQILTVTPGTLRDINSLYEDPARLYSRLMGVAVPPDPNQGSWVEHRSHTISMGLFLVSYIVCCVYVLWKPKVVDTLPALACWLGVVWFLYCMLGSPWFWPWYLITFFGLAALVEADDAPVLPENSWLRLIYIPFFVRILSISMFSLYCFSTYAADQPVLPHLRWMYLRGPLLWFPPLFVLFIVSFLLPHWRRWRTKPSIAAHKLQR
jgi:hypothetical protein